MDLHTEPGRLGHRSGLPCGNGDEPAEVRNASFKSASGDSTLTRSQAVHARRRRVARGRAEPVDRPWRPARARRRRPRCKSVEHRSRAPTRRRCTSPATRPRRSADAAARPAHRRRDGRRGQGRGRSDRDRRPRRGRASTHRLDARDVGHAARGGPRRGPIGVRGRAVKAAQNEVRVARRPARLPRSATSTNSSSSSSINASGCAAAARQLDISERVPAGLGEVRRARSCRRPTIRPATTPPSTSGRRRRRRSVVDDDEPTAVGDRRHGRVGRRRRDGAARRTDSRSTCSRRATAERGRSAANRPSAEPRPVRGRNGVDEAITSEPPEERRSDPLSRTGRVQPVSLAKSSGRSRGSRQSGWYRGPRLVPGTDEVIDRRVARSAPVNAETSNRYPDRRSAARPAGARARRARPLGATTTRSRRRSSSAPAGDNGDNEFVFYDGPPFANGLPHYGHLLTGFVKDAVPRYQTMRGRRVERRFGWDCHGLPAEVEGREGARHLRPPRDHRVRHRQASTTPAARACCGTPRSGSDYVTRQARWVDFDNDYKTLDLDYMESVMWAFKTLWDKGLIYEGFRVLAYCWRCETPLSNTETRMDDVYRDRQDPALTVWFELDDGERMLDWTTTPWTLPSNLALAVGPDIDYAVMEDATGSATSSPTSRLDAYAHELAGADAGRHDEGLRARRPPLPAAVRLLRRHAERVPGAGRRLRVDRGRHRRRPHGAGLRRGRPDRLQRGRHPDDLSDGRARPVHRRGHRLGRPARVRRQRRRDPAASRTAASSCATTRTTTRTRTAGAATSRSSTARSRRGSWRSPQFRDRMVELNQQIRWVPEHVKDGSFGKWLANARDWSISRNRFWGSPIPVWKSDDPSYPRIDVYGSLAELERDFGVAVDRPAPAGDRRAGAPQPRRPDRPVDDAPRAPRCSTAGSSRGRCRSPRCTTRSRTPSGSSTTIPATSSSSTSPRRAGWFYTMHVLATALFDRPAFSNCVSHGIVLGDDGRKMSKSLQQLSRPAGDVRRVRRRRHAVDTCCRRRSCAAPTSRSPRPASATPSATCSCRSGTRSTS